MSLKGKAYIMGAWEHPTRDAPDKTTAQLHFESARGALADKPGSVPHPRRLLIPQVHLNYIRVRPKSRPLDRTV
jgi:hypothetical protein